MMNYPIGRPVLNSYASTVVSEDNRVLYVSGTVSNNFEPVNFLSIQKSSGVLKHLNENVNKVTVTYTATANTTYSFVLTQNNQYGVPQSYPVTLTTGASTSDAAIATALVAKINALGGHFTATGAASPLTISGETGYALFASGGAQNVTLASGMTAYTPHGTPSTALSAVIAPDGTAGTAIAGTTTVTVTTAAAHGLVPGDQVTIASVATMTLQYVDPATGKSFTAAAGGTFYVATVPTATTFTLENVQGAGTNSGTITITAVNCVFLTLNGAPSTAVAVGDQISVTGVATMTVNGASSFTARVGTVLSTTKFKLEEAYSSGTNSGTIVPTLVASAGRGLGTQLTDYADITSTNNYAQCYLKYSVAGTDLNGNTRGTDAAQVLYINEGDTDFDAVAYSLTKKLKGLLNAPFVNSEAVAVI